MKKLKDGAVKITEEQFDKIICKEELNPEQLEGLLQRDKNIQEFLDWEKEIMSKIAFYYYGDNNPNKSQKNLPFEDENINKDIMIKILQNDIRLFLKKCKDMKGTITIQYDNGKPVFMDCNFEAKDKSKNNDYEELKEFVGDYGIVGHKKYGIEKKLYGEKQYRYNDKKRPKQD